MANLNGWKQTLLGDVTYECTTRLGSTKDEERVVYGVDRQRGLTPEAKYASSNLERYKLIEPGMFAYNPMRLNIGSIGYCSPLDSPGLVSPDYVVFGCHHDQILPDFLQYVIKGPGWKSWMGAAGTGSVRVRIYYRELQRFPLLLPPLSEQHAIASVLGSLDDKINLNHSMNETLEEMTRAIFKSWFVDFDPVRAKMDGRQPVGMDDETAALFPDSFEDSPLGEVPSGWRAGRMAEIASPSRATLKPGTKPEESFDHYSIPAFDKGRMPEVERGGQIKSNKFVVPENAILLSRLNPRIPRCWLPQIGNSRRSICSTEYIVALPEPPFTREFLFALFTSSPFVKQFQSLVTGTSNSHQRVKAEYWYNMDVLLPDTAAVDRFTAIARRLYLGSANNLEETLTLAAIRDTLLPTLLSGEVRVGEAVEQVEEVL